MRASLLLQRIVLFTQGCRELFEGREEYYKRTWHPATDPASGREYFFNHETKETQWERPVLAHSKGAYYC